MHQRDNLLFYEGNLNNALLARNRNTSEEVNAIPKDQFLSTPEQDLIEHVCAEILIEPLTLYEESMEMEQHETEIDVSGYKDRNPFGDRGPINVQGIRVVVSVPFTGDPDLWKIRPNQFQTVFPRADVCGSKGGKAGHIELIYQQPSDEQPQQIKQRLESDLMSIRFYIDAQRNQIEQFNKSTPENVRQAVQVRRQKLEKHDGIANMLGIPMKRRDGVPSVKPILIKRALVKPLPPPPKSGFKPEPGIANEEYEHILSVIRHEGRTFEATPKTYAVHGEEELRDIILAHLNGHYHGGATGETFRRNGKTDIRIEDDSRAAFVAECKVWRGQNELIDAINQLLNYLTWRDCKASIIIFNKENARFTELLDKIPNIMKSHVNFKRDLGQQGDGEWRYIFTSAEDQLKQVIVNVFIFDIYAKAKRPAIGEIRVE
ncbi:MAG: hypothetical protein U1D41_10130 [Nitrosomonas sp.]|uniref:hypothetical protein n=1 Tax=Nitrosomonas sp. TaxID=42353 RepID=UPI0027350F5B|nr:hypothetical protein [Nitrosomonas sp.]MDP3662067.1 hypothetical protein [Nitrosomonas sp.]MDZ4106496.1 hypothetical protein [Nitrosomonas sp.]